MREQQEFTPPSETDRTVLSTWTRDPSRTLRLRSRIVLARADGLSVQEVAQDLGVSAVTVTKWARRYAERGLDGLADAPRSGRPRSSVRADAERLVGAAIEREARGEPVPSTRVLAEQLGLSQSTVARIWQEQSALRSRIPGQEGRADAELLVAPAKDGAPATGTASARAEGSGSAAVPAPVAPVAPRQTTLPRRLLSDHVYALLRDLIVSGELAPGQRIVESDIARRVGTSQAPAREAVKRLAHEGLVNSQPHRGTYVTEVSDEQARDVREIRVLLEMYAARRTAGRLTQEFAHRLEQSVEAMRCAADDGSIGDFRDADMAFHRTVCAACGNGILLRLWRIIEPNMWGLHVVSNPRYGGDWRAMAELHVELLEALRDGEPAATADLFAAHAAGEASRYRREHPVP
ncbi:FCD domain-containing protein [Streptomyces sp. NBC_00006]|uniref:FCD domain-containing protein n=1 Tax=unclassified Streptomyces TaxID=2593676 RepID=UPI0022561FD8|nr:MULTISPECIES: FCD domain-containing protein [unclassified Streptomyces]MCX4835731.1 FCD domain-containing protein [Streptomyces sp. NBC_01016]MCX5537068.1 FCD domain-containing protein [Streptomyces sp. NBC_00006]